MDDATLRRRERASVARWIRLAGAASPGAEAVEWPGLVACVAPALPERSLFNCALELAPGALERRYDELAALYARRGIAAWTVWVAPGDAAGARALAARGHRLDAAPTVMGCALHELRPAPFAALDLQRDPDPSLVGELNDRAWRTPVPVFAAGLRDLPRDDGVDLWVARADGRPAAAAITAECDGDVGVYAVGTVPEASRRGLGAALLSCALSRARERGCTSTTLQASVAGRPVYARLGYRDLGTTEMWEHRRASV